MSDYLVVLRQPHALRVFLPALVGRLSIATLALALLLTVERATGSYALAGAASGVFGVANVLASPGRARLVDRRGQRPVLTSLAIVFTAALGVLAVVAAFDGAVPWVLLVLAAIAGVSAPPLGAAMRVLWGVLTPDDALRARAFSLDAVAQEVLFTTGPLLVAVVISLTSPAIALMMTAGLMLVGTLLMTSSATSRARVAVAEAPPSHQRPLAQPGFRAVLVALLGVGCVLGVVEVAAPAVGSDLSQAAGGGILLAVFSAGSAIGGLVYGHRSWRSSSRIRLLTLGSAMAVVCALLVFAPGIVGVAVGFAVVGAFLAPSLVTGYVLADDLTEPAVRTEASSWIDTAVNTGAALAAAGGGALIDRFSPGTAFVAGGAVALVCLAVAARRAAPAAAVAPGASASGGESA